MLLTDLLNPVQAQLVLFAVERHIPIVIAGKHAPTGKSTLCGCLLSMGADAVEQWELDEGDKKVDGETNHVSLTIHLNEPVNL